MRHAIRYEGGFERNFSELRPGATDFEGDDGERHKMVPWPSGADGLRFGFMERHGKRFVAVRVQFRTADVVLAHDVPLDAERHLGGHRLSAEPVRLDDDAASALLGDAIDANPAQRAELSALRDQVRGSMRGHASHQSEEHTV
jgi:hypothetical protein